VKKRGAGSLASRPSTRHWSDNPDWNFVGAIALFTLIFFELARLRRSVKREHVRIEQLSVVMLAHLWKDRGKEIAEL
jgi:hypothetical protein